MWALFDHWQFLAGLGIFLFGMYLLEESVKLLAGRSLRTLIRRATDTRLKGLLVGITTTALLQSSSAVSLMVLAFVGAGLMSLANAVAVILGTNIGTTATAWIVALAGFGLKIDALALPGNRAAKNFFERFGLTARAIVVHRSLLVDEDEDEDGDGDEGRDGHEATVGGRTEEEVV